MPNRRVSAPVKRPRDIRDLLGFRLSLLTTISDRKAQSQISGKFGMNLGEWRVLGAIHAFAPATLAGLARELYQDKGQLSRTIKALSERGLVASAPDARDKRNLFFRLTPGGKRWHDRMLAFAADRNAHLVDGLNAKERVELFRLLDKLVAATAVAYEQTLAAQGERKPTRARTPSGASQDRAEARQ
ncbi:MAG TPA: MarR family winged helix-turn-helix transcriptional regulator [Rhodoblastus sp.]|nr:MarR family winged helix-turn-helix transcriptional regulator [Rhodoblastus sp.]